MPMSTPAKLLRGVFIVSGKTRQPGTSQPRSLKKMQPKISLVGLQLLSQES